MTTERPGLNRVRGAYRVMLLTPSDMPGVLQAMRAGSSRAAVVMALVAGVIDRFDEAEALGATAVCACCDSDLDGVDDVVAVLAALPEPGAGVPVALGVCQACVGQGVQALLQRFWPGSRPIHPGAGHA